MYRIPARVYVSQTDRNGQLRLDAAVDLLQDCSQMWFESEPALEEYFKACNINQMIAYRQVDVLRMPDYGEQLGVETRIFECRGYYGYRNTSILDEGGTLCLQSWSIGAFVNLDSGRMVRMPNEIAAAVVMDEKLDMPYTDKRVALPEAGWQPLPPVPVRRSDIDYNRHMNNARYVETAMELLPEGFVPRRLRAEYKLPVAEGAQLYPRMARPAEGRIFLTLDDADGRPCTLMEFIDRM